MAVLDNIARAIRPAMIGLVLAGTLAALPGYACAQSGLEFFLTAKFGKQDPGASGDTIIPALEADFGEMQGDREVNTFGVEVDMLMFPTGRFGVGLGLEYHVYDKEIRFVDPAGVLPNGQLQVKGKAFLYTIKFYAQTGILLNYIGLGSGIYVLKYVETGGTLRKFRGSSEDVVTARVGTRMEFGRWSVVLEYGQTNAPVKVEFRTNTPTLELGGPFLNFGVGYAF